MGRCIIIQRLKNCDVWGFIWSAFSFIAIGMIVNFIHDLSIAKEITDAMMKEFIIPILSIIIVGVLFRMTFKHPRNLWAIFPKYILHYEDFIEGIHLVDSLEPPHINEGKEKIHSVLDENNVKYFSIRDVLCFNSTEDVVMAKLVLLDINA